MKKIFQYIFCLSCLLAIYSCSKDVDFHSEPYGEGKGQLGVLMERTQKPSPEVGSPGTQVKIKVSGLTEYQDKAIFTFNGQKAEILNLDADEITVKVPIFASTGVTSIIIGDIIIYGPTFEVEGKVKLDPTWQAKYGSNNRISNILTTSEGKNIIIGDFTNYENKGLIKPNNRIVRTYKDGQYDASFRVGNGSNGFLSSIIQIQNAYYLAGSFSGFDQRTDNISNLTKIDLNGKIDTMPISPFRPPHLLDTIKYYPRFNGGFNTGVNEIYNHNGKILAVGNFRFHINRIYGKPNFTETRDSIILDSTEIRTVALLNLDGTLDKSFRFAGGKALAGANGNVSSYYHESGSLKGKLLVFGAFKTFDGQPKGYIVRLNADGTIDNTFNVGGEGANYNISNVTYNKVTKQYMVVGAFVTFNGVTTPKMVLLNEDGKIDNTFKVKDFGRGFPSYAKQLDDGLIAVSGPFSEYNGIVRQSFMIIDSKGDLVPGMNNSGELRGYAYRIVETNSDDGKRALLLLGDFSKFNNIDARNITRLIIE